MPVEKLYYLSKKGAASFTPICYYCGSPEHLVDDKRAMEKGDGRRTWPKCHTCLDVDGKKPKNHGAKSKSGAVGKRARGSATLTSKGAKRLKQAGDDSTNGDTDKSKGNLKDPPPEGSTVTAKGDLKDPTAKGDPKVGSDPSWLLGANARIVPGSHRVQNILTSFGVLADV
jgi:hypothetical protein